MLLVMSCYLDWFDSLVLYYCYSSIWDFQRSNCLIQYFLTFIQFVLLIASMANDNGNDAVVGRKFSIWKVIGVSQKYAAASLTFRRSFNNGGRWKNGFPNSIAQNQKMNGEDARSRAKHRIFVYHIHIHDFTIMWHQQTSCYTTPKRTWVEETERWDENRVLYHHQPSLIVSTNASSPYHTRSKLI